MALFSGKAYLFLFVIKRWTLWPRFLISNWFFTCRNFWDQPLTLSTSLSRMGQLSERALWLWSWFWPSDWYSNLRKIWCKVCRFKTSNGSDGRQIFGNILVNHELKMNCAFSLHVIMFNILCPSFARNRYQYTIWNKMKTYLKL